MTNPSITKHTPDNRARVCRILGVTGMVGAPMIGISLLLTASGVIKTLDLADGVLSFFYIAGFLCIAVGLRLLRVTGENKLGLIVSAVQIAGLAMAEVWALLVASHARFPGSAAMLGITDLSWPFSHIFMLVVAWAAHRARVSTNSLLWAMFLLGCALPAAMGAGSILGNRITAVVFALMTAIPLWRLGYALSFGRGFSLLSHSLRHSADYRVASAEL